MLLRASDIALNYAEKTILGGVSLLLENKNRVALTGRNGSGKTSLLKILMQTLKPDSGSLEIFGRLGWLEQDPDFVGLTVQEVMFKAMTHLQQLETKLRELEQQNNIGEEWASTLEAFEQAGGYVAQARAEATLEALGLTDFLHREANSLSGGERTRLALAAILIAQPDVLLLDEPTNHLDIEMRIFLEKRLLEYHGAVLIVSHDRRLLDAVCQETLHLERGEITRYTGGYTKSRAARLEARRIQAKSARIGGFEWRRLRSAAKTVAAWGVNNAKLARRAKALASRAERLTVVEAPVKERVLRMQLQSSDAKAKLVLRAERISKTFGQRMILSRADLRIRTGDRVALLAKNGAGKTTLLKILLGELPPDIPNPLESPEVRYSDGTTVAYFDQNYHGLNQKEPVLDQLSARVGTRSAIALLGRYGFPPEMQTRAPNTLSGGERARAGLAFIAATRADVLILDEPTNHLDVETLEALEEAILGYPGSVLFVTHDRSFASSIATRVMTIDNGQLLEFEQGFLGYEKYRKGERRTIDPARLLEGENPPPPPKTYTPEQQLQILEERDVELEDLFLHRGLTEREWQRYRIEVRAILERLSELHADRHATPTEYDHAMTIRPLEIRAVSDETGLEWQFWAKNSAGCPTLHGVLENQTLTLHWRGETQAALPWFTKAILRGAISLGFERIGCKNMVLPDSLEPYGKQISSLEYAVKNGLMRPQIKRKRRRKKPKSIPSTTQLSNGHPTLTVGARHALPHLPKPRQKANTGRPQATQPVRCVSRVKTGIAPTKNPATVIAPIQNVVIQPKSVVDPKNPRLETPKKRQRRRRKKVLVV
jgi:ATPase subunit of ABC transporter with duplicated ATPase domains